MAVTTIGAIIGAAVIGAGSAHYQASKQEEAAKEAAAKVETQRAADEAEALRIAQETRPEGEAVKGVAFGSRDLADDTFGQFIQPKSTPKTSGLATSGLSGLGFA